VLYSVEAHGLFRLVSVLGDGSAAPHSAGDREGDEKEGIDKLK